MGISRIRADTGGFWGKGYCSYGATRYFARKVDLLKAVVHGAWVLPPHADFGVGVMPLLSSSIRHNNKVQLHEADPGKRAFRAEAFVI